MKVTIAADGTVELEVHNGEGQAALDLIRSLQAQTVPAPPVAAPSYSRQTASLTPLLREAMDVLAAYPEGCHYTALAEYLGLSPASANSRFQELRKRGFATWLRAGVYAPVSR